MISNKNEISKYITNEEMKCFCVINMQKIENNMNHLAIISVEKSKYNFGIMLNKDDDFNDKMLTKQYYSINIDLKYYVLNVINENTRCKIIFIDIFGLFIENNDVYNVFFDWMKFQINSDNVHTVYIVSEYDPFFFFNLKHNNEFIMEYINIIVNHNNINKIVYITTYDDTILYSSILKIWPYFCDKIKMININNIQIFSEYNNNAENTCISSICNGFLHINNIFGNVEIMAGIFIIDIMIKNIINVIVKCQYEIDNNLSDKNKTKLLIKFCYDKLQNFDIFHQIKKSTKNLRIKTLKKNFARKIINKIKMI